jgi:GNAT superfamily N-acetyltransferase
MPAVEVHPLTPDRWPDLERLFGPSGGYSNCWCTWWRQRGADFDRGCADRGAGNRALLRALTDGGAQPGLIAYRDGLPVGWVSVGPRTDFGRILRSPKLRPSDGDAQAASTWSITCFWIPRRERGAGLARALLDAAVAQARRRGAREVEAYPIDTAGRRPPSAALFTGTLPMFERAGFREVERRSPQQPIVRLAL